MNLLTTLKFPLMKPTFKPSLPVQHSLIDVNYENHQTVLSSFFVQKSCMVKLDLVNFFNLHVAMVIKRQFFKSKIILKGAGYVS